MTLKPQDVYVVLKLIAAGQPRPSYAQLAADLVMSPSEVHASVKRAEQSGLLHGPAMKNAPNLHAVEEFLVHGLRYVFPAQRGEMTRGVVTSYGAPPLASLIAATSDPPPVWPCSEGKQRGLSLLPLYKSVPQAARKDPVLYELLALADALRDGRVRERKLAQEEFHKRIRGAHAAVKP